MSELCLLVLLFTYPFAVFSLQWRVSGWSAVSMCGSCSRVNGTVTDAVTGLPLAGAKIQAANNSTVYSTDGEGMYAIIVQAGAYDLIYAAKGYTTVTDSVILMAGENYTVNEALLPVAQGGIPSSAVWSLLALVGGCAVLGVVLFTWRRLRPARVTGRQSRNVAGKVREVRRCLTNLC